MDTPAEARLYSHDCLIGTLPQAHPWKTRQTSAIKRVVLHRNTIAVTPRGVAKHYIAESSWPGHPYHFHVEETLDAGGCVTVHQANRLSDITYGVGGLNTSSIHVMALGDFRRHAPTEQMLHAVAALCVDVISWLAQQRGHTATLPPIKVLSHSEASLWAPKKYQTSKQCPGKRWPMDLTRQLVQRMLAGDWSGLFYVPRQTDWITG